MVDPVACLNRQVSLGSTGPEPVREMLEQLAERLKDSRAQLAAWRDGLDEAYATTRRIAEHALAGGALEDIELP